MLQLLTYTLRGYIQTLFSFIENLSINLNHMDIVSREPLSLLRAHL